MKYIDAITKFGRDNQLHAQMARVDEFMAKVKARHGTDAATYLGFNTLN